MLATMKLVFYGSEVGSLDFMVFFIPEYPNSV